jgi:1-deoxy-D-xylulose-5-phosphate reductoisomerase
MKKLAILGSTGSIGIQTLEVIRGFPERFEVAALSCGLNVDRLFMQIKEFHPLIASVQKEEDALRLQRQLRDAGEKTTVFFGEEGNRLCATLPEAEMVVAAMVGVKGLAPVVSAIDAGKDIALANKETLVAGGSIVIPKLKSRFGKLLPVDSEHSAIWQCLWGQPTGSLDRILLTASGGPFRGFSKEQLQKVTVSEALSHPTWKMGGKITIDSATMMNKGLEVIEAGWLFDVPVDQVTVVVHPQSIIHSMVRLKDGSVLAQMGRPNMMLPIQIALSYPLRLDNLSKPFDPFEPECSDLHFEQCNSQVFGCLELAFHAGRIGGSLPVIMNSANEEAVAAFLEGRIPFTSIEDCIRTCMDAHEREGVIYGFSVSDVYEMDQWSRNYAKEYFSVSAKI